LINPTERMSASMESITEGRTVKLDLRDLKLRQHWTAWLANGLHSDSCPVRKDLELPDYVTGYVRVATAGVHRLQARREGKTVVSWFARAFDKGKMRDAWSEGTYFEIECNEIE
jgi:hypothetical protein